MFDFSGVEVAAAYATGGGHERSLRAFTVSSSGRCSIFVVYKFVATGGKEAIQDTVFYKVAGAMLFVNFL